MMASSLSSLISTLSCDSLLSRSLNRVRICAASAQEQRKEDKEEAIQMGESGGNDANRKGKRRRKGKWISCGLNSEPVPRATQSADEGKQRAACAATQSAGSNCTGFHELSSQHVVLPIWSEQ